MHARRLTMLLAWALLLPGCHGATHRVVIGPRFVHIGPPAPTALRFPTEANRRFADRDVQRLIGILELPRGARLVARVPASAPARFRTALTGARFLPGIAVTHRVWIVHGPIDRVARFVRAHVHPRPRPMARFRAANNGIELHRIGSYQFPPLPGRSWERWLNVEMVALSGGGTAVIAQAGDAWVHAQHTVPLHRNVRRIDVLSRLGNRAPNVLVHVRRRYDVGSIVAMVNGLSLSAARVVCADFGGGPTVTLRFRAADGTLLARASVSDPLGDGVSGPCNPVQLTVRGAPGPPLIGADLVLQLQRLLGIDLAPPVPGDVARCLQRRGWQTHARSGVLTATKHGRHRTITFHATGKVTVDRAGPRGLRHCVRSRPRYAIFG